MKGCKERLHGIGGGTNEGVLRGGALASTFSPALLSPAGEGGGALADLSGHAG